MSQSRILIVNADDFGQSAGVNQGIIESHEQGIATSASLMVRGRAAGEAADYALSNHRLGVGLHLDLGEWSYSQNQWRPRYEVVRLENEDAVRDEVRRQLDEFRRFIGRDPTHVDSHQHVHRVGAAKTVAAELARELEVPLRHFHPKIAYCGHFYGQPEPGKSCAQAVSVAALINSIQSLNNGVTELACHPGDGGELDSDYCIERGWEKQSLCALAVRELIDQLQIQLCSFASPEVRIMFQKTPLR